MPYQAFIDFFPDLAKRETRCIIVPPGRVGSPLPEGEYALIEQYCNDGGCDCRRVFFFVQSSFRQGPEAVIAWGWESREFYARWMGDDDEASLDALQGPVLNVGSPQTDLAPILLEQVETLLSADTAYVARIREHYRLFRQHVDGGRAPAWFASEAAGAGPGRRRPGKKKRKVRRP